MDKEETFYLTKNLKAEKFKKICQFFNQKNLEEFYLNEGGTEIILKKNPDLPPSLPPSNPNDPILRKIDSSASSTTAKSEEKFNQIEAPLSGVFYTSPNPEAPPFVQKGDRVKKGQVIAIIEAMKVMNKVYASLNGEIKEILIKNADPVAKGTPLILIK